MDTRGLPDWVASYVGIPFVALGSSPEGCDCWGLLALVLREQFGVELPDYVASRWGTGAAVGDIGDGAGVYASQFAPVPPGAEKCGDGVLLRLRGAPIHVGLVVRPGLMLHCAQGAATCLEDYRRWAWKNRVIGFYRHPLVT